ncbi:adenylate and guanylate cyclase catalytic domain-containing protein [Powellomyces hirtus]|nr:adenylate and guanylate cyclase catalytic domain-containing protein [Powellomyces hirtus]
MRTPETRRDFRSNMRRGTTESMGQSQGSASYFPEAGESAPAIPSALEVSPHMLGPSVGPSQQGSSNLDSCSYVAIDMASVDVNGESLEAVPASSSNRNPPQVAGTSIWNRLKRHGQWMSSKMNISTESLDDAGAAASGGSSGGGISDNSANNRLAKKQQQRSRRWVSSSQHSAASPNIELGGDVDTESETQMFRLMAERDRREGSEDASSPTDYLQSTMKDLFNREKRGGASYPRRPVTGPGAPPGPQIQSTRRLSERMNEISFGQPGRPPAKRESESYPGPPSALGGSRRSSLRSSNDPLAVNVTPRKASFDRTALGMHHSLTRSANDLKDSSAPNKTISGQTSQKSMARMPTNESILQMSDPPASAKNGLLKLPVIRSSTTSRGSRHVPEQGDSPNTSAASVVGGGCAIPAAPPPFPLRHSGTSSGLTQDPQAGPSSFTSGTAPLTLAIGPNLSGRHGDELDHVDTSTARASVVTTTPTSGGPGPRVQQYLSLKDALLTRGTAIPSVQPTGVEPPDLSASSLNFETGGMLPEKYLAGPAPTHAVNPKLSRKQSKRRRTNEPGSYGRGALDADTISRGPLGLWEAFQRPLSESPSTTWTLTFPHQIEQLYLVWLFHLWMKPFQMSVLLLVTFFWVGWSVLEFFVFPMPSAIVHVGSLLCVVMCLTGLWWCRYKSWEKTWYRFMLATFAIMALDSLNISANDLYKDEIFDPFNITRPTNTIRIIFVQTAISGFAQLPFYQVAMILWIFTFGQIAIEASAQMPNRGPAHNHGYDVRGLIGNWLLYVACSIVGTYFRYAGEVHLRKAFIKYRIAYRNQERLFAAREQSEYLLSMILPAKVIETLHNLQGKVSDRLILSTHETFMELHGVTIMFADLVGFTEFSASITADTLVQVLSELFSEFDALVTEFGLETIKTIGDCIQIAGGVPEQLGTDEEIANHAERVCTMSLIMLTTTNRISANIGRSLKLRIGIHTGTVIGGVMGLWKFKYDIWSRDVDIASLVEQTGTPNVPHVSHATYMHLQNRQGLSFSPAATIQAFGRPLPTYDMLVLDDHDERLEQLAERLRVRNESGLGKSKLDGSGEAVTAAAVRQAIGASGPLVFSDLPNPMGRAHPVIKGKNNIGVMVKNFGRSIKFWTSAFKDVNMEEDYRENYVRNWPGAMILSSCIVFICYLCLLGMHISVFPHAPKGVFVVEVVLGVIMLGLILFVHRINRPLRTQTIVVMDKGDRLSSALWMTSAEEIGRGTLRRESGSGGAPGSAGRSSQSRRASRTSRPELFDKWRWFRPNTFALSTIMLLFLANIIHFATNGPEFTKFHSAGMAITIICGLVFPGIRIYYMNVLLGITTLTFMAALLATTSSAE